jgi:hypothetical protein
MWRIRNAGRETLIAVQPRRLYLFWGHGGLHLCRNLERSIEPVCVADVTLAELGYAIRRVSKGQRKFFHAPFSDEF